MKTNPSSQSGFFHRRVVIGIVLCLTGVSLAMVGFAQNKNEKETTAPWPSLAQQLARDYNGYKIERGAALEKLIRENQDFSILREDEKNDKLRFPPWLRVWWRKQHPELKYSADDPTGGYPRALNEILEWMLSHQDLKAGPGIEGKPGRQKESKADLDAVIGADLRISGLQSVARSESDIRINYWDPMKIVSASNAIVSSGKQAIYFSTDGGVTWNQTLLPATATDTIHSDPTCDWTSDGRAWSSTLGIAGGALRLRNYYSSDNGATWTFDGTASGSQTSVDKQMVWVDHSPSSPFRDQMYAIWHSGTPAFMNRRTAGPGGKWLASPILVSGAESSGTCIGSDVKTNSAGDVFGSWPTTTNRRILIVKSTNGGASFGAPVIITTTFDGYDIGVPSFNSRRALIYVSLGTYKTTLKDNVYASWTDLSAETGCTAAANEPGSNVNSTCKTRIWFARSIDGGATWSAPVKINNQPGLNDQFNQWLAVDETSGGIGIMYYDTVNDPGRKKTDVWYQSSGNDGASWSAPQKVTTGVTDETISGADSGNQYGDYNGLTAYASTFFPSWTDRRNFAREEVWTAKITDTFAPTPNIITGGSTVVAGTCGNPAAINPGTQITVNFCVQNNGTLPTTNLVGTLQATGSVANPSGPQNYGAVAAGGSAVCRSFSFVANAACAGTITASVQFQDGSSNFGTLTYPFTLSGGPRVVYFENFDAVIPPMLPACWSSDTWVTSNSGVPTPVADSLPNAIYVDDPAVRSDKILNFCSFSYNSASTQLTFRNNYALEPSGTSSAFDCGLLEFSADNGATWNDIILAGGSFVEGGYNRTTISTGFQNPCFQQYGTNKPSWSGSSGGFVATRVNLPASGIGQQVQLRWRMCSDTTVSSQGWRLDNVAISDGMICPPVPVSAVSRKVHGSAGTFDVDLPFSGAPGIECRSGGAGADYQVVVTFANSVTLDGASISSGTATVGSVNASGQAVTVNLTGVANAQTVWISLNNVNDGTGSGCAAIPMSVLVGDTNGNGSVNSADVSQAKARIGENVNSTNFRADVNANGAINAGDISLIKSNIGTGLP